MNTDPDEKFFIALYEVVRANNWLPGVTSATDPVATWQRMKAQSRILASKALKAGVSDLLEITQDLEGESLASVDRYLRERGAPTLTARRLEETRWIGKLLKQKTLEGEEEYRAIMSRLNETEDRAWSASQRDRANELVAEYETRVHK